MPTPNGVNYLLQVLLLLSNSPIIEQQELKVDVPVLCPYMFVAMLPYALKFYWFNFFIHLPPPRIELREGLSYTFSKFPYWDLALQQQ